MRAANQVKSRGDQEHDDQRVHFSARVIRYTPATLFQTRSRVNPAIGGELVWLALDSRVRAGAVMVNDLASYFGGVEASHGGGGLSGWGRTHSRVGLLEMVQVKYIDVDWLPRRPKAWWFGYDQPLTQIAERFIGFSHAPEWRERWRNAAGAVRALFRKHRI